MRAGQRNISSFRQDWRYIIVEKYRCRKASAVKTDFRPGNANVPLISTTENKRRAYFRSAPGTKTGGRSADLAAPLSD